MRPASRPVVLLLHDQAGRTANTSKTMVTIWFDRFIDAARDAGEPPRIYCTHERDAYTVTIGEREHTVGISLEQACWAWMTRNRPDPEDRAT